MLFIRKEEVAEMFIKNSVAGRNLASTALVYFLIGNLFISTGIGGMMFFDEHSLRGMPRKLANVVKTTQKAGAGLQQTNPKQKRLVLPITPMIPAQTKNNSPMVTTQNHSGATTSSMAIPKCDLPMLARIIHAEAGGESLRGQVAVGAVLLNRIKSGRFPRSLVKNIFSRGEFESVSNGYIWSDPAPDSYQAARLAMNGWDPTHGALYFFNPAKTSSRWIWSRPIIVAIGRHNFAG
jgi:spore germination cell wall hydrolase CwlJ-like protein